MLSDAVTFCMNIHARFLFDDRIHERRARGELSVAELDEMMVTAQRDAYLNSLADDGWNPRFWVSKLHFYITAWPFYNFPYSFGYLLSLGLYSLGSTGGGGFSERYRNFLIATGSMDAEEVVRSAFGYDLTQPDFWDRSLDIIRDRVRDFTQAASEILR
jgi:oligoendopeptidase F